MKLKKRILIIVCVLVAAAAANCVLNFTVDPFDVFGNSENTSDTYTLMSNTKNGKAIYVSENFDKYDSYIIGSSAAASFLPESLEKYMGGKFYNMFHDGADISYDAELVKYLTENDEVKNIVLVLGTDEANKAVKKVGAANTAYYKISKESKFSYYAKFIFASPKYACKKLISSAKDTEFVHKFDVIFTKQGTYDRRLYDSEPINSLEQYLKKYGSAFECKSDFELENVNECVAEIAKIKELCKSEGCGFTVILSPIYAGKFENYTDEALDAYFEAIASVTDYWNFAISPISYDARFFYDAAHVRTSSANTVLARMANDCDTYFPSGFGVYFGDGSAAKSADMKRAALDAAKEEKDVRVPILMYHHIDPNAEKGNSAAMEPTTFEHQIKLLLDNGCHVVGVEDIMNYVEKAVPLPENPVMITFDDGYSSVYDYAFPILEKLNIKASVFVIGTSLGHDTYKDTKNPIIPHFGAKEAIEMASSGVFSIGSHTYDMHQAAKYEQTADVRSNMLPFGGESEAHYISAIEADVASQREMFASADILDSPVIAYPEGKHTNISDAVLFSLGYKMILYGEDYVESFVVKGLPQSMVGLDRITASSDKTDEEILSYVLNIKKTDN